MKPFIIYHGSVTRFGAAQVEQACIQLMPHQPEHVTLLICSGGGDVNAGIGVYNFLRMMPFEVHTHAFGLCGSIAATMYLAGKRRTVSPASKFTLHAASFIEGPRKGQISENTAVISEPFRTELGWDESTIENYFGTADEKYITNEEAINLRLAHGVETQTIDSDSLVVQVNPDGPAAINLALSSATTTGAGAGAIT